jgi:hypothetical protein
MMREGAGRPAVLVQASIGQEFPFGAEYVEEGFHLAFPINETGDGLVVVEDLNPSAGEFGVVLIPQDPCGLCVGHGNGPATQAGDEHEK